MRRCRRCDRLDSLTRHRGSLSIRVGFRGPKLRPRARGWGAASPRQPVKKRAPPGPSSFCCGSSRRALAGCRAHGCHHASGARRGRLGSPADHTGRPAARAGHGPVLPASPRRIPAPAGCRGSGTGCLAAGAPGSAHRRQGRPAPGSPADCMGAGRGSWGRAPRFSRATEGEARALPNRHAGVKRVGGYAIERGRRGSADQGRRTARTGRRSVAERRPCVPCSVPSSGPRLFALCVTFRSRQAVPSSVPSSFRRHGVSPPSERPRRRAPRRGRTRVSSTGRSALPGASPPVPGRGAGRASSWSAGRRRGSRRPQGR